MIFLHVAVWAVWMLPIRARGRLPIGIPKICGLSLALGSCFVSPRSCYYELAKLCHRHRRASDAIFRQVELVLRLFVGFGITILLFGAPHWEITGPNGHPVERNVSRKIRPTLAPAAFRRGLLNF